MKLRKTPLAAATLLVLALPVSAAFAQDAPAPDQTSTPAPAPTAAAKEDAKNVGKVTVTGSRIKRAAVEGPAP